MKHLILAITIVFTSSIFSFATTVPLRTDAGKIMGKTVEAPTSTMDGMALVLDWNNGTYKHATAGSSATAPESYIYLMDYIPQIYHAGILSYTYDANYTSSVNLSPYLDAAYAAAKSGDTIVFSAGRFRFYSPITIGNGTNTNHTTKVVKLKGSGGSFYPFFGTQAYTGTVIERMGSGSTSPMIIFNGSGSGFEVDGIAMNCNGRASGGLLIYSAQHMILHDFSIYSFPGVGLDMDIRTGPSYPLFGNNFDVSNFYIISPSANGAVGLRIDGQMLNSPPDDWWNGVFRNGQISISGPDSYQAHFKMVDSIMFDHVYFSSKTQYVNPASITRSGSTATLVITGGFSTTTTDTKWHNGDTIVITGADQPEYNGEHVITYVNSNTVTFPVTDTPVSPATGPTYVGATKGVIFDATENDGFPVRLTFYNSMITHTKVIEDASHHIGYNYFHASMNGDGEVMPTHPKLSGVDDQGRVFNGGITELPETSLTLSDNTTNNVSTTKHGFIPKLPNDATKFFNGVGAWSTPSGSGGASAFTGLSDVPTSYTSQEGKVVQVNAGATGLEFGQVLNTTGTPTFKKLTINGVSPAAHTSGVGINVSQTRADNYQQNLLNVTSSSTPPTATTYSWDYTSAVFNVSHNGAGTSTKLTALSPRLGIAGGGTLSGGFGLDIGIPWEYSLGASPTGTVTQLTGIKVAPSSGVTSGTANISIGTFWGLYLESPTALTGISVTDNWAIYQKSAAQKNYFAGQIIEGVYTTSPSTCSTSYTFDPINGGMQIMTLSGACAISIANPVAGTSFTAKLITGTTLPTWGGTNIKWHSSNTAIASKDNLLTCVAYDTSFWKCILSPEQ